MKYASIADRLNAVADGRGAAAIVIVAVMLFAIANSFVMDDAFISFRYARNLAETHELAWNPGTGERVEGYSNFLWTLLMAAAIAAGADPVPSSKILGLLFALGTLLVTYRLAARIFQSRRAALLTVTFLGTNYTFSAYATSGLETQMQTFLIATSAALAFSMAEEERRSILRSAAFSGLCAAALLTRLDSAIPVVVLFAYLLVSPAGRLSVERRRALSGAALVLPAFLIVGAWFLWRHAYYGSWLPNSYYVKGAMFSLDILKGGVVYLFDFSLSYCLLPMGLILLFMFKDVLARGAMRALACICALWFLYIMRVGGDFMEFRFVVPVLPFLFILVSATLRALRGWKIQAALAIAILLCSAFHAATFRGTAGTESVRQLRDYIYGESGYWELAGKALGDLFPEGGVTIATTAAGTIPYYSKLPAVDMLGMNDAWVARNGASIGPRAGHRRAATLAYLDQRGVNLVIGHPIVEPVDARRTSADCSVADLKKMFMIQGVSAELLPADAKILEIPLHARYRLTVLYLRGNARVDALIKEKGLATFPIARS
jgi:arabinofuranosyltransferase